jgi:hypothetical protein
MDFPLLPPSPPLSAMDRKNCVRPARSLVLMNILPREARECHKMVTVFHSEELSEKLAVLVRLARRSRGKMESAFLVAAGVSF